MNIYQDKPIVVEEVPWGLIRGGLFHKYYFRMGALGGMPYSKVEPI